MDPRDLKSASTHVNNMLASRGLLRGSPIDFARLTRDNGTPARIINLVHELITRRDRDAEQRENLAITIRGLRDMDTKHTAMQESLRNKNAELEREISLLQSRNRSLNSTMRTAESSAKSLRDETVRLKSLLAQIRTQCANDIRKRDVQLQKMKERLDDTRRGTGSRNPASHIVVTAGSSFSSSASSKDGLGLSDSPTALAQDTADFLTTLSQSLSDENDNLVALLRQSLSSLRAIQGLPDITHVPGTEEEVDEAEHPVTAPPANYEALAESIEVSLNSLRELLNQPNYVPIEELEERDAQIVQLTQRNETLQEEWKKAIDLVDGWNKTLARSHDQPAEAEPVEPPLVEITNGKENRVRDGEEKNTVGGGLKEMRASTEQLEPFETNG